LKLKNKNLQVALVQMDCRIKDKEYNFNRTFNFLKKAEGKADIICFPEFFTTGYSLDLIGDDFYNLAETIPGETTKMLSRKAKEYRLAIVGGIVEKDDLKEGVLYDTAFIIDAEGNLVGKYRKFHLYPTEYRFFRPGDDLPTFDIGIAKIGVAICYDHAFPELFRLLSLKGAQIVFIPSAVPQGYEYLLNLRTRARAQDNQIFVAAVNRVGQEGKIRYCGLSKMVNPKGEVIAEALPDKEEILFVSIDLELILNERKQEPILRNLRKDLYQKLLHLL